MCLQQGVEGQATLQQLPPQFTLLIPGLVTGWQRGTEIKGEEGHRQQFPSEKQSVTHFAHLTYALKTAKSNETWFLRKEDKEHFAIFYRSLYQHSTTPAEKCLE